MIESKEQLLSGFSAAAQAFLAQPGPIVGIDFDEATVALKRYVLTVLKDQELANTLGGLPRLIRKLDTATLAKLVGDIETRLR